MIFLSRREWKTLDYKTWSIIEYKLTVREFLQMIKARIMAMLFGNCAAHYMSEELENLLCMYVPERHKIVEPFVGHVEKEKSL